jgi:hypothetical protein
MAPALSAEEKSAVPPPPRAHWIVWIFAVVGAVGILMLAALFALALGFGHHYEPPRVAGEKKEAVFTVSAPQPLRGTQLMAMNVNLSEGGMSSNPYSGGRGDQRNVVLIDKTTGASRKLLPDNSRTIDQIHFLPAEAGSARDEPDDPDALLVDTPNEKHRVVPPAYYLLVLRQAAEPEARDVLVGTLDGARHGFVMQGIDGVESVWMHSPTQIGIVVRDHLKLYYRIVDIPALKVVLSRPVAID